MKPSDPGFTHLQSEPWEQSSNHFSLDCLQLYLTWVLCFFLLHLWLVMEGSVPGCCGSEYAGKASGPRRREGRREGVVISEGFRVVYCSVPLHWMVAGTAECLPMAQLFANLSPPPPAGLQCTLPLLWTTPFPTKKNNSDLIWLSLPLSVLPRPIAPMQETAVWDLIKSHPVHGCVGCFFSTHSRLETQGGKGKEGKKQSRAFWLKAEMCLVHHAHTIISAGTRSRSTPGCEMCSLALLFMWSWKYAAHRNFKQSWFWLKQIYSNTCTTKTHSFPSSVYVFISHLNTTQICWKCRGALSLPRSTVFSVSQELKLLHADSH